MRKLMDFDTEYIKGVSLLVFIVIALCSIIFLPLLLYCHVPRFLAELAVRLNSNWKLVMLFFSAYIVLSGIMYCKSLTNKLIWTFVSIAFCIMLYLYYPWVHSYLIQKRIHNIVTKIESLLNNKNMPLDLKKKDITKVIDSSFPAGEFEMFYDEEDGHLTTIMVIYKRAIFKPNDNIVLRYSSSGEFLNSKFNIWSIPVVIKPNWQFFYHQLL